MKTEYINEILKLILLDYPDAKIDDIRKRLIAASIDEVERLYDTVSRFGVKIIFEEIYK